MKKRIGSRLYDTDTAKKIITKCSAYGKSDNRYYEETLYCKRTGEFFLYGEGNADSKYCFPYPGGGQQPGCDIVPLSFTEAKEWYIEQLNDPWGEGEKAQYQELFETND